MADREMLSFWDTLYSLQSQGVLCDVQLCTTSPEGDVDVIPVHKLVLVASSRYFAACLEQDELLETYSFDGISFENLCLVVQYIYRQTGWSHIAENVEAAIASQTLQVLQHDGIDNLPYNHKDGKTKVMFVKVPNSRKMQEGTTDTQDNVDASQDRVAIETDCEQMSCVAVQTDEEIIPSRPVLINCSSQTDIDGVLPETLLSPSTIAWGNVEKDNLKDIPTKHQVVDSRALGSSECEKTEKEQIFKMNDSRKGIQKLQDITVEEENVENGIENSIQPQSTSNALDVTTSSLPHGKHSDKLDPQSSDSVSNTDASGLKGQDIHQAEMGKERSVRETKSPTGNLGRETRNIDKPKYVTRRQSAFLRTPENPKPVHVGPRDNSLDKSTDSMRQSPRIATRSSARIGRAASEQRKQSTAKFGKRKIPYSSSLKCASTSEENMRSVTRKGRSRLSLDGNIQRPPTTYNTRCQSLSQEVLSEPVAKRLKHSPGINKGKTVPCKKKLTVQLSKEKYRKNDVFSEKNVSKSFDTSNSTSMDKTSVRTSRSSKAGSQRGMSPCPSTPSSPTSPRRSSRKVTLTAKASEYFHGLTNKGSNIVDNVHQSKSSTMLPPCKKKQVVSIRKVKLEETGAGDSGFGFEREETRASAEAEMKESLLGEVNGSNAHNIGLECDDESSEPNMCIKEHHIPDHDLPVEKLPCKSSMDSNSRSTDNRIKKEIVENNTSTSEKGQKCLFNNVPVLAATGVTQVIVLPASKVNKDESDSYLEAGPTQHINDIKESSATLGPFDVSTEDGIKLPVTMVTELHSSNTEDNITSKQETTSTSPVKQVSSPMKNIRKSSKVVVMGCIIDPTADELKCTGCSRSFKSISALVTHEKRVHLIQREFMCESCGIVFARNHALMLHVRKTHGQTLYTCRHCGAVFKSREGWKIHEYKQHTAEDPMFACETCGKTFFFKNELRQHQTLKHSDARPFLCELCPRAFKSNQMLKRHVGTFHSDVRKYQCDLCGTMFKTSNDLKRHRLTHSTPRDNEGRLIKKNRYPDGQLYPCRHCGKIFKKRIRQIAHENMQHKQRHAGTMYICTVCNKGYPIKHYLMQHIRHRHSVKRFRCEQCGKYFLMACELRKHQQTPSRCKGIPAGPKPYKCPACQKGFTVKGNLTRHQTVAGRCKGMLSNPVVEFVVVLEQQEGATGGMEETSQLNITQQEEQVDVGGVQTDLQSSVPGLEDTSAVLHIAEDNTQQIHIMQGDHSYDMATQALQPHVQHYEIGNTQDQQGLTTATLTPEEILQLQGRPGEVTVLNATEVEELSLVDFVDSNVNQITSEQVVSDDGHVIQVPESLLLRVDELVKARAAGQGTPAHFTEGQEVDYVDESSTKALSSTVGVNVISETHSGTDSETRAIEHHNQAMNQLVADENEQDSKSNIITNPVLVGLDKSTGEIQLSEEMLNKLMAGGETLELQLDNQQQEVLILQPGDLEGSSLQTVTMLPQVEDVKKEEEQ